MPAIAKFVHILGAMMKVESTYNTSVAPLAGATDGVHPYYKQRTGILGKLGYAWDGDLGPIVGSLGSAKRISPSALEFLIDFPHLFRGSGAAYSASVVPSFHTLLKACGYTGAVDVTGGAEKWTYTPTVAATQGTSVTGEFYPRGQKIIGTGGIGTLKMDAADLSPPLWTASLSFAATTPTDASVPAITYPNAAQSPPPAANCAFTMGNFTAANAMVKKSGFDLMRGIKRRVAQQATGPHLGFVPGDRNPRMKVTLEQTAFTTTPFTAAAAFDPYSLRDVATSFACTLQYGSAQYGRFKILFAQAQVVDYQEVDVDDVPCIELTIDAYNTTPTANDDHTIVTD